MGMKVINGDFSKKKDDIEETPLIEKLAMVSSEMVNSIEDKGNFILIVENEEGSAQIATDLDAAEVNILLDIIKQQLITGSFAKGAIH
jgi:hypothetical protein